MLTDLLDRLATRLFPGWHTLRKGWRAFVAATRRHFAELRNLADVVNENTRTHGHVARTIGPRLRVDGGRRLSGDGLKLTMPKRLLRLPSSVLIILKNEQTDRRR
jgi:hypothetical protein